MHGISQPEHVHTLTIRSWLKLLRNGRSNYSQDLLPRIYQIVEEINRRFVLKIQSMYPGNQDKVKNMAILYDGQVKMAHLAIAGSYSVNGVAALHTKILEEQRAEGLL